MWVMGSNDRISAPQSQTGLMRFYDVSASNIQLDPKVILGVCIAVIALELVFHFV